MFASSCSALGRICCCSCWRRRRRKSLAGEAEKALPRDSQHSKGSRSCDSGGSVTVTTGATSIELGDGSAGPNHNKLVWGDDNSTIASTASKLEEDAGEDKVLTANSVGKKPAGLMASPEDLRLIRRYATNDWLTDLRFPLGAALTEAESRALLSLLGTSGCRVQNLKFEGCLLPASNSCLIRPLLCDALPRLSRLQYLNLNGNALNGDKHA